MDGAWMKTVILYEDQDILVCEKPAGLAVQSARASEMDMESELRNYLHGCGVYVVHRLDQPVEGLLVFAKSSAMAAKLGAQMKNGTMKKYYRALVCGRMQQTEGEWVDEIVKKGNGVGEIVTGSAENGKQTASDVHAGICEEPKKQTRRGGDANAEAKRAVLSYQVESYDADTDVSNVKICLQTGRFHQIRLQFSHAGHPLVGDRKYGDENAKRLAEVLGLKSVALCAERLCFRHPRTGKQLDFSVTPGFHKK
ncbi:MAG: RluA family pseudouridine synthase [Lachnospiraceae bacterium]|nr:RluA family pseudouridine synthase [Lachnospiraceae bacterium]